MITSDEQRHPGARPDPRIGITLGGAAQGLPRGALAGMSAQVCGQPRRRPGAVRISTGGQRVDQVPGRARSVLPCGGVLRLAPPLGFEQGPRRAGHPLVGIAGQTSHPLQIPGFEPA